MVKGDKPKNAVLLKEIWSLVGLVIALLIMLLYFSSENLNFSRESISAGAKTKQTSQASDSNNAFLNYLSKNRKAIAISGWIVLSLVIVALGIHLLIWQKRRKRFAKQNAISSQRVEDYERRLRIASGQ